jgi:predicted DNA-binding protein (UPF0251 family)
MSRPRKCRFIKLPSNAKYFKPRGIPLIDLQEVVLTSEELEALRLKELQGLSHQKCAQKMKISRTTFHRDLEKAHRKITDALINNKAIKIEGKKL